MMRFLLPCWLVLLLAYGGIEGIEAQEPAPKDAPRSPAEHLASLLDTKQTTIPAFAGMFQEGSSRELALHLMEKDEDLWQKLERDFAQALEDRFSEEQLSELITFFESPVGTLWREASPALYQGLQVQLTQTGSAVVRFSSIGCVVGMLGPNFEQAKQKAGVETGGLPEGFFEAVSPLLEAATTTCDCVMNKAAEEFGIEQLTMIQGLPDFQVFVGKLFDQGECPRPASAGTP